MLFRPGLGIPVNTKMVVSVFIELNLQVWTCTLHATLQKHLSECIEALDEHLDPTATSSLSLLSLCRLIWLLTRQKPSVCISRLRVSSYGELYTRLCQRHQLILQNSSEMQQAMAAIRQEPLLTDAFVQAISEAQGWCDHWMTEVEPKARGRGAKAVSADLQAALAGAGPARAGQVPAAGRIGMPLPPPPNPNARVPVAAIVPDAKAPPPRPPTLPAVMGVLGQAAMPLDEGNEVNGNDGNDGNAVPQVA